MLPRTDPRERPGDQQPGWQRAADEEGDGPMRRIRVRRVMVVGLAVSSGLAILGSAALASTTSVAYSFKGDENGEYPSTDLVIDRAGNIFGTTVIGGDFGSGTVFEVSPSGSGFTQKVLYSFT